MKKKWIRYVRNGVMGLLIAAGIAGGIFFVGRVRGWFPSQKEQAASLTLTAKEVTGTVLVERDGLSYQLKESERLQIGDQVTLKGKGTMLLSGTDSKVYCEEQSAFLVGATGAGAPQLTLIRGELFSRSEGKETLRLVVGNQSALLKKGTADLAVTGKKLTLDVLSGSVSFFGGDKAKVTDAAGKRLRVHCTEGQWGKATLQPLKLADWSNFELTYGGSDTDLYVTKQQMHAETVRREKAAQAALEAKLKKQGKETSAGTEAEEKKAEKAAKTDASEKAKRSKVQSAESQEKEKTSKAKKEAKEKAKEEPQKKTQEQAAAKKKAAEKKAAEKKKATKTKKTSAKKTDNQAKKESSDEQKKKQDNTTTESSGSCTIRIECSTILNNMDDLKAAKRSYVPSSGVILKKTTASFRQGETVYDVLTRTCKKAGIQMEVSYSGGYGSYYVEGIGNLYEFDCGRQSGWVYTVNGTTPNYGCSSCQLKDGDRIEWSYTCKGLGSDVT